jgi:hypothetical protein
MSSKTIWIVVGLVVLWWLYQNGTLTTSSGSSVPMTGALGLGTSTTSPSSTVALSTTGVGTVSQSSAPVATATSYGTGVNVGQIGVVRVPTFLLGGGGLGVVHPNV